MTQGTPDVRRTVELIYDAMTRRDLDAALEHLDPEIEWVDPPNLPDRRPPFRGRKKLKEVWLEYFDVADGSVSFSYEILELMQSGRTVFVDLCLSSSGTGSRPPVAAHWYQIVYLDSAGSLVRLENYFDRTEALEAADMSP